jgi:hypothetical protein
MPVLSSPEAAQLANYWALEVAEAVVAASGGALSLSAGVLVAWLSFAVWMMTPVGEP